MLSLERVSFGRKKETITPEQARDSLLAWVQQLMSNGYTITEIKKLKTSDLDLMVRAMETQVKETEKETTLDKAFPLLFG